jgi:hypothetical protein
MKARAGTTVLVSVAVGAVLVAVVAGLMVLPPPTQERVRRLDERRVEDLRGIARAMDVYWTRHGRLVASLEDLSGEPGVRVSRRDPGTGQEYELRLLDESTYELCASFERPTTDYGEPRGRPEDPSEDFWSHGVGLRCFRLDAQEVPAREQRPRR